MTELQVTKTATAYETEVVTDKIEAIQITWADDMLHKVDIAVSVDGDNFISNATYKIAEKTFCQVVADDVDGLSKKIVLNHCPVKVCIL